MAIDFYPFELHAHTRHSDGRFAPQELAANVASEKLTGFALTDHNTATGVPYAQEAADDCGLVFIPGIEWTTFYGHITVLGGDFGIDWRRICPSTVQKEAAFVKQNGGCVGIAHPCRIGYPICTGGSDEWGIEDYKDFTHYEIWSYADPSAEPTNVRAEARYRALAAQGSKLACVYGRDWHGGSGGLYASTFLGMDGKPDSRKALEAIRRGRSYVSLGIRLNATLSDGTGKKYCIGEEAEAGEYTLTISIEPPAEKGFNSGRLFEPQKVYVYTPQGQSICPLEKNQLELSLKAQKGFMQLAVDGRVDGLPRRLLIATPYYIQ
jgi:hypothetical protein